LKSTLALTKPRYLAQQNGHAGHNHLPRAPSASGAVSTGREEKRRSFHCIFYQKNGAEYKEPGNMTDNNN
jgi:hypothetical protein